MKELIYHRHLLPATEQYAEKVAVIDGAYTATYTQHLDRVQRTVGALPGLGVGRGDRFAVMALNSHQFLELYHAAFLGAGVVESAQPAVGAEGARVHPRRLGHEGVLHRRVLRERSSIRSAKRSASSTSILIGGGDVPHDLDYEELLAAATPTLPDEPEEDDPSSSCTPAARPARRRACSSTSAPSS